MGKKLTIDDLEKMTTHELSDLLANIVLMLNRLPDVPLADLQPKQLNGDGPAQAVRKDRSTGQGTMPDWVEG